MVREPYVFKLFGSVGLESREDRLSSLCILLLIEDLL